MKQATTLIIVTLPCNQHHTNKNCTNLSRMTRQNKKEK